MFQCIGVLVAVVFVSLGIVCCCLFWILPSMASCFRILKATPACNTTSVDRNTRALAHIRLHAEHPQPETLIPEG